MWLFADYGLEAWSDPFDRHMYKYAFSMNAIPRLAHSMANIIKSIHGKNKKSFELLYLSRIARPTNKFGDNDVVAVTIGKIEDDTCHIVLWLMNCRVLKRDMEFAMMDALVLACKERGVTTLKAYYDPTAKTRNEYTPKNRYIEVTQ